MARKPRQGAATPPGQAQRQAPPSAVESGAARPRGPASDSLPRNAYWLFGRHAVQAALANPKRRILRAIVTGDSDSALAKALDQHGLPPAEVMQRDALAKLLPPGAVHQGLALACRPLSQPDLEGFIRGLGEARATLVVLDQITDPQNVGAILRSAAAFGAAGLLTTQDRAPEESGTLAKAASGALEVVPYLRETNLARALERLKQAGFWCLGLDEAGIALAEAPRSDRLALVMGAEGDGLRRLTKQHCDALLRLPTRPPIGTLNVSNAAAVALYELTARGDAQ
ncbi:MAG: 23S rRNA (guanosine(2251)-2'-O)-methyltransferase RlmB [Kiloniellales bacterium]